MSISFGQAGPHPVPITDTGGPIVIDTDDGTNNTTNYHNDDPENLSDLDRLLLTKDIYVFRCLLKHVSPNLRKKLKKLRKRVYDV